MKVVTSRVGEDKVRALHWAGIPAFKVEMARLGGNRTCVDCGDVPLDGGLRCLTCFGRMVKRRGVRGAQHRGTP